jgi:hypothetical protein
MSYLDKIQNYEINYFLSEKKIKNIYDIAKFKNIIFFDFNSQQIDN